MKATGAAATLLFGDNDQKREPPVRLALPAWRAATNPPAFSPHGWLSPGLRDRRRAGLTGFPLMPVVLPLRARDSF